MSSFATEIGNLIISKVEKLPDQDIKKLILKLQSYTETNCWYMEYQLKNALITACKNTIDGRIKLPIEE